MKITVPMIALRGKYVYPKNIIHFDVSRSKSIRAMNEAMKHDQMIFLNNQIDPKIEDPLISDLYQVGTLARIKQLVKLSNDVYRVFVEGIERSVIQTVIDEEPIFRVTVDNESIKPEYSPHKEEGLVYALKEEFEKYNELVDHLYDHVFGYVWRESVLETLVDEIATHIPFKNKVKQAILEQMDLNKRAFELLCVMRDEVGAITIKREIQEKVQDSVDKNQRDFILREQLKAIREELGEGGQEDEAGEFFEKLQELSASDEVKEKIRREILRFQSMGEGNPEHAMLQTYLEIMLEMPWEAKSEDSLDLEEASAILEEDHYGLDKVKERVLEYLAARAMSGKKDAAILCLVGPPGTGKTSIAKSIARATHKEYARLSLGGVRDEAEIRGHRRTYIGAMQGRISDAIRRAGVRNPLMLLDEVDKVGTDARGDTASALLEVLDPEQNEHFRDHYLDVDLNLSDVLFIATANDLSTIPRPLLDRMEIIEVSSYSENEKYHIAERYLVSKQMDVNGLKKSQIVWKEDAIRLLIDSYTREAGVRNLERRIGQVSRKVTKDIYQGKCKKVTVTKKRVMDYLGMPPYDREKENLKNQVGLVHGLAWTSVGGETLKIEVNVMSGKGKVQVTGSLGDVMKESAQAAISYIRSQGKKYKIKSDYFDTHDIHIHIPEGAVPKDGPSAGITMTVAVLSAITNTKVYGNLAMTGEVTIRGDVLPIGGLKEKLLAAKRIGITKVLVPKSNESDVKEFHEEIINGLDIIYVNHVNQVVKEAFVRK